MMPLKAEVESSNFVGEGAVSAQVSCPDLKQRHQKLESLRSFTLWGLTKSSQNPVSLLISKLHDASRHFVRGGATLGNLNSWCFPTVGNSRWFSVELLDTSSIMEPLLLFGPSFLVKRRLHHSPLNRPDVWSYWTSPHGPGSGQRHVWAHAWLLGSCGTAGGCCSDTKRSGGKKTNTNTVSSHRPARSATPLFLCFLPETRPRQIRRWPSRHSPHRKSADL